MCWDALAWTATPGSGVHGPSPPVSRHAMPPVSLEPKISVTRQPKRRSTCCATFGDRGAPLENTRSTPGSSPSPATVSPRSCAGTVTRISAPPSSTAPTSAAWSGLNRKYEPPLTSGTSTPKSRP